MIETTFAQLRSALSQVLGTRFSTRSLERLVASMRDTRHEFGQQALQAGALLLGPQMSQQTRESLQWQRFRAQARRAARETPYYRTLFEQLQLDPAKLRPGELSQIPLTRKEALRQDPDAFICEHAHPYLRATTTGTTGTPTSVCFSEHELRVYFAFTALSALSTGEITPEDIVQISTSARGTLGNVCLVGACAHIGAMTYLGGVIDPAQSLLLLSEQRKLAGKKPRTSILYTYPSYLGDLVEQGLRMGYRPSDFGLQRIIVGGEIVTQGLKERSQRLFGSVTFGEGYGMTEIWPFGARLCEQNHLHFEATHGLLEMYNPQTQALARPGEVGTIVATPFSHFRETTLVLRYHTEDLVQALPEPQAFTCRWRHLPATGNLLGKQRHAIQQAHGWTFPRQVAEALEAVEVVPLPARYGFWEHDGGVAVEVVTKEATPTVRCQVEASLQQWGIPLRALHLVSHPHALQHPRLLRGDLREHMFAPIEQVVGPPTAPQEASLAGVR